MDKVPAFRSMISGIQSLNFFGGNQSEPSKDQKEVASNNFQEENVPAVVSDQAFPAPCRSDSVSSLGSAGDPNYDEAPEDPYFDDFDFENDGQSRTKYFRGYDFQEGERWNEQDTYEPLNNSFDNGSTSTTDTTSTASSSSGSSTRSRSRNPFILPPSVLGSNRQPLSASALLRENPRSGGRMGNTTRSYQNNSRRKGQTNGYRGSQARTGNVRGARNGIRNDENDYRRAPAPASPPIVAKKKDLDLSWTPKPVENPPEEIQAQYDSWDPMAEDHYSTNNIRCYDATTTLKGIPEFRGTICPFSIGGKCYKGSRCYCEHHLDREMLEANPKMAIPLEPTAITHFTQLPLKRLARAGVYFRARITYVRNIHEFYIVPIQSVKCECISKKRRAIKKPTKSTTSPVQTIESIMKNLQRHFETFGPKYASSYSVMQLVAIEGLWKGRKGYFRAVMIEEAVVEGEDFSFAKVYCFDIGRLINVRMDNMRMLPKQFCRIPPLAYRCSLYGMRYAAIYETQEVNDFFADSLLKAKDVIVHVRVPFEPDLPEEVNNGVVEEEPYLVELFTVEKDGFKDLKNVLKLTHDFIEMDEPRRSTGDFSPNRHSRSCIHGYPAKYVEELTGLQPI